jgi:hypothetical protein
MKSDNLAAMMADSARKLMNQAVQARREGRLADAKRNWTEALALCRR